MRCHTQVSTDICQRQPQLTLVFARPSIMDAQVCLFCTHLRDDAPVGEVSIHQLGDIAL